MRHAVHLLEDLGCAPANAAIEVGLSVPEIDRPCVAEITPEG